MKAVEIKLRSVCEDTTPHCCFNPVRTDCPCDKATAIIKKCFVNKNIHFKNMAQMLQLLWFVKTIPGCKAQGKRGEPFGYMSRHYLGIVNASSWKKNYPTHRDYQMRATFYGRGRKVCWSVMLFFIINFSPNKDIAILAVKALFLTTWF